MTEGVAPNQAAHLNRRPYPKVIGNLSARRELRDELEPWLLAP